MNKCFWKEEKLHRLTDCELFPEVKRIQMLVLKAEYGVTVINSMFDISLVFTLLSNPANDSSKPSWTTNHDPSFSQKQRERPADRCMYDSTIWTLWECVCARICALVCVYTPSAQVYFVQLYKSTYWISFLHKIPNTFLGFFLGLLNQYLYFAIRICKHLLRQTYLKSNIAYNNRNCFQRLWHTPVVNTCK